MFGGATSKKVFPNYMEMQPLLPIWIWHVLRVAVLAATLYLIHLLMVRPALGLALSWKLLIPILPIVFAVAPGLWRNVCPMAFLNQIPRTFGFSRERTLPPWAKTIAFLIAVAMFFVFTILRHPWLNHDGDAIAWIFASGLLLALVGGIIFKGRSGWCGTFCPLAPIQKVYGQAPLALIRNGYCAHCVGCQKNCYDFNPRAAIFSDVYDQDTWYADHRKFFVAALPGLLIAFFTVKDPATMEPAIYYRHMLTWPLLSIGLYQVVSNFTRLSAYKIAVTFSMLALATFYWFAVPLMVSGIEEVLAWQVPNWSAAVARAVVIMTSVAIIAKGLFGERAFLHSLGEAGSAHVSGGADALKRRLPEPGSVGEVTERSSGHHFTLHGDEPLLDALEEAGIPIETGCRMGLCGADPVRILDGSDNLSPPSNDELATLKRLGLEGTCRLACQCHVTGPVTIDVAVDKAEEPQTPAIRSSDDGTHVVIIGNGVAGITAAETLRSHNPRCKIDIVARESHYFYNRMGLGRVVYGRSAMGGLYLLPDAWYSRNNISVWRNTIATAIDRQNRTITLGTREALPYDRLILATGASAFFPPLEGKELAGNFVLREADDALRIRAWCQQHDGRSAVVLGGGVLGVEAADALRRLGLHTTIVHRAERLMERQLDGHGSDILRHFLEGIGVSVHCNVGVDEIVGGKRVEKIRLSNGEYISADIFLACTGIRPNMALAKHAGLKTARGVIVNERMQTSDPDIYAIGDVAEFAGSTGGLWPVGMDQAKVAACAISGEDAKYSGHLTPVHLKVRGIDIKSYGEIAMATDKEEIAYADSTGTKWRKIVIGNHLVTGAVFINEPRYARVVWATMKQNRKVDHILNRLRTGDWEQLSS